MAAGDHRVSQRRRRVSGWGGRECLVLPHRCELVQRRPRPPVPRGRPAAVATHPDRACCHRRMGAGALSPLVHHTARARHGTHDSRVRWLLVVGRPVTRRDATQEETPVRRGRNGDRRESRAESYCLTSSPISRLLAESGASFDCEPTDHRPPEQAGERSVRSIASMPISLRDEKEIDRQVSACVWRWRNGRARARRGRVGASRLGGGEVNVSRE